MDIGEQIPEATSIETMSPGSSIRKHEAVKRPAGFNHQVPFDPNLIHMGKINKKLIDEQKQEQMIKAECRGLSQKIKLLDALVDN